MRHSAFVIAAWLMSGACHVEEGSLVLGRPDLARSTLLEQRRMHARFDAATRIEHAIAFSDLDRARGEAGYIAEVDVSNVLPTWRPYLDSVRDAALQVQSSRSLSEAARMTVALGQRCASCHVASSARVEFPAEPRPAPGPRLAAEMQSHQWAAAQMWWGLIGPSDAHWTAGARALSTARLTSVAYGRTPSSEFDIDDVARIRLYANRAIPLAGAEARADLFGTLLTTCAHCHALLRDR